MILVFNLLWVSSQKKIVLLLAAALPGQFESLRNFYMSHLHFIGLGHFEL
jgi:hypothetical protein